MENVNATVVYSLLVILVAICSIAGFLLGRKKEATDSGKTQGSIETNLKNMADQLGKMSMSLEKMNDKIDTTNELREKEYRELLIMQTKLDSSYRSLHKRVDFLYDKLCVSEFKGSEQ